MFTPSFIFDLHLNYLIHYCKNYVKNSTKDPDGTRRPGDTPWRSSKCPNIRDLQGTFRGLLGGQQENWWFDFKKVFFRCSSLCFKQLLLFFTAKTNSKVVDGEVYGTSTGLSCGTFRGPNDGTFWGRPQDVCHICF